jgi:hypothetical protein
MLSDAVKDQVPPAPGDPSGHHGPPEPSGPGSTPQDVAGMTRREQKSEHNGKNELDRDDHLTQIGRGQQTHG